MSLFSGPYTDGVVDTCEHVARHRETGDDPGLAGDEPSPGSGPGRDHGLRRDVTCIVEVFGQCPVDYVGVVVAGDHATLTASAAPGATKARIACLGSSSG